MYLLIFLKQNVLASKKTGKKIYNSLNKFISLDQRLYRICGFNAGSTNTGSVPIPDSIQLVLTACRVLSKDVEIVGPVSLATGLSTSKQANKFNKQRSNFIINYTSL